MTVAGASRLRWLACLLLAVIVTRIPLLLTGYSSDPDAWRVAYTGKTFWETGHYVASRLPGYPIHEIATGVFVLLGGSLLSNTATLIVSLVLIIVWHRFVEIHTSSAKLLTFLLAFNPLFWIDSAATLDYVWSLLFILLALSAAQQKKALLAGMWLGCAIGCRPTNAVAIVPLLILLRFNHVSRRAHWEFALGTFASVLAALSPVLWTYGVTGWMIRTVQETGDAHLPVVQRVLSFLYRSVYGIGPLAIAAIAVIVQSNRTALMELLRRRDPLILASLSGVFSFAILFAVFPLDRSYLLPSFPFLVLILERIGSRTALVAVTCCVVSFALVNPDVIRHQRPAGSPGFNIHPGIVIDEWQRRNQLMTERDQIGRLPINGKAVVMIGTSAAFWFENQYVEVDTSRQWRDFDDVFVHSRKNPDLHFIAGLPLGTVRSLQAEGYTFYCLDWMRNLLQRWNGYDPLQEGVQPITP